MENYEMYQGSAYTTPVEADCSSDLVPAVDKKTSRVKVLADGITMTKYLFDHYRLSLYSFLNRSLRDGSLSGVVGFHVMNRVIQQYALLSGCIRNVHYPLKSGNFVQRVQKKPDKKRLSCPVFGRGDRI